MSKLEKMVETFGRRVAKESLDLKRNVLDTLQINIGKLCNQACSHCHVEAGPSKKRENMDLKTVERVAELVKKSSTIKTVDITGGAPELNPHFKWLVQELFAHDVQTIDRCNLTVLGQKGQEETHHFLAQNKVKVVASLPCYSRENVDKQRGQGVFGLSIDGLKKLNQVGYAKPGTGLTLDLVYNPVGPHLPPDQAKLEADYKVQLHEDFGIEFNHLYCITNMPIKRYLRDLERQNKLEEYMTLLVHSFNRDAAEAIMCRNLVSVSWDGFIFDCDFNQMLEMPIGNKQTSIFDIDSLEDLNHSPIAFANHCYGCTAGAGSSCGGTLT
jgi:radical SAM/Cys-rich protein